MQALESGVESQQRLGRELSAVMDRMMGLLLRGVRRELSRTAMATLATLRDHGAKRIPQLAENERVAQPSMTALVNRLEEQGFVRREADPDDGRAVRVRITDDGLGLQRGLQEARAVKLIERLDELTDSEREQLAAALPLLDRRLAGQGPPPTP